MTVYTTTVTATNSANNTLVVNTVANMTIGMPITFTGVVFGGITANATYYIQEIFSATEVKITSLPGGTPFVITTATGTMTATFSSGGQYIIETAPPGEPLEQAFTKINQNFDQIFASGPVLSNIAIANNTIRTLNTNGNIVLAPNGIGRVVANVDILPNASNIRNLGSPTNRWGALYVNTLDFSGNLSIGNLSIGGDVTANTVTANSVTANSMTGNTVTITATYGNIELTSAGNIVLNSTNGNIDARNHYINNVLYPIQDTDAANKNYVDTVAQGLDPKASVALATTTALPAYVYNNGSSGAGATISGQAPGALSLDSVAVAVGQRVLIKNETGPYVNPTTASAVVNGIYVVTATGSGSTVYVLTRAPDFNSGTEVPSSFTFVQSGNILADTGWVCITNSPVIMGTTQILWSQFSGAGTYTAGAGLSLNGTQFNVNVDPDTTIINGSNQVAVKASANLVTPNIGNAIGNSVTVTGNLNGNNLSAVQNLTVGNTGYIYNISSAGLAQLTTVTGATVSATGNISTAANIVVGANVQAGNLRTTGIISSAGNVTAGGVTTSDGISAGGNINGGNVLTSGLISATGTITGGNVLTSGLISATGTITGGNVLTSGLISATGNITGNNITIGNAVNTGTLNTTGNAIIGGNLVVNGNVTYVNVTDLNIQDPIIGLGRGANNAPLTTNDGKDRGEQLWYYSTSENSAFVGYKNSTGKIILATNVSIANEIVTVNDYGNLLTGNLEGITVSVTGNVDSGNIRTTGVISASGTVTAGSVDTAGVISAAGTITGGNLVTTGTATITGNISTNSNISTAANINSSNIVNSGTISSTGNITGGNINALGAVSATGNVQAGNLRTTGIVSASGDITTAGNAQVTGNVQAGNLRTTGDVSVAGNVTATNFFGNISGNIDAAGANTQVQFNDTGDILGASAGFTFEKTANLLTVDGNIQANNLRTTGVVTATGNITGGNINTADVVSAAGNINGGNINTAGVVSATGNITGGNIITSNLFQAATISATGNVRVGNLLTNGVISTSSNIIGNNINIVNEILSEVMSINGNIQGGNINTANTISAGGTVLASDVSVSGTVTAGTVNASTMSASGTITALSFIGNIQGNIDAAGSNTWVQFNDTTDILGASAAFTFDKASNLLTVSGNVQSGNTRTTGVVTATGNVIGGNINTAGVANIAGNVIGGNITTVGQVSATGNITTDSFFLGNGALITGIDTASIQNGNSNVRVLANSNVVVSIAGTSNVAVFATTGEYVTGVISATGNIDGANINTAGLITAVGNITGGNIDTVGNAVVGNALTTGLISATGNITGGNIDTVGNAVVGNALTTGLISATGNIDGGNINTANVVSAVGNINGGNINTTGNVQAGNLRTTGILSVTGTSNVGNLETVGTISATGNLTSGNISTAGLITAVGNITGGNIDTVGNAVVGNALTTGLISATGNVTSGNINTAGNAVVGNALTTGLISATGNIDGGNLKTSGQVSATANITGGNLRTSGQVSATATITGGNILTSGVVSATGNITGGNLRTGGTITALGNITSGNILTSGVVSAAGNITGGNIDTTGNAVLGNVLSSGLASVVGNITGGNINTAGLITATGNVTSGNVNTAGNAVVGNVKTTGLITATGNITGGNINTAGLITATGNIDGGNINTAGLASVVGNVIGGNISTVGLITATGNITSGNIDTVGNAVVGNVLTSGLISATGNITSGNIDTVGNAVVGNVLTSGLISATGNIDGGNINTANVVSAVGNIIGGNINTANDVSAGGNIIGNLVANVVNVIDGNIGNLNFNNQVITAIGDSSANIVIGSLAATGNIVLNQQLDVISNVTNKISFQVNSAGLTSVIVPGNIANSESALNIIGSSTGNTQPRNFSGTLITGTSSDNSSARLSFDAFGASGGQNSYVSIAARVARGNVDAPSQTLANDVMLRLASQGWTSGGAFQPSIAIFQSVALENFTSTASGTQWQFQATPVGSKFIQPVANIDTTGISVLNGGNVTVAGLITAVGNIIGANINTAGLITAVGNVIGGNISTAGLITATGNVTSGNVNTAGNAVVGNVLTSGLISATGNVTSGNVNTAGNAVVGNVLTSGLISATGNITGGNVKTLGSVGIGTVTPTAKLTILGFPQTVVYPVSGNSTVSGTDVHISGADASDSRIVQDSFGTGVKSAFTGRTARGSAASPAQTQINDTITQFSGRGFSDGTLEFGNICTGTISIVAAENFTDTSRATKVVIYTTPTGTITPVITTTFGADGTFSVVGNIIGGNINTANVVSATGNINGGNINTAGVISATGNIISNSYVLANNISPVSGNITITAASGNNNVLLQPTGNGNIIINNKIVNGVASPILPTDAANKQYVDDAVSSGLHIHEPVQYQSPPADGSINATYTQGGTTQTVDSISGNKTITFTTSPALQVNDIIVFDSSSNGLTAGYGYFVYSTNGTNQVTLSLEFGGLEIVSLVDGGPGLGITSRANSGIGAILTNAGANVVFTPDGYATIVGDRVLISSQTNGYENGVYVVTTVGAPDVPGPGVPWVLTRANDANQYLPQSPQGMGGGDYFFVQGGIESAGDSYVLTEPIGTIIVGTDNIVYTQFSAAIPYTPGAGLSIVGTEFNVNVDPNTIEINIDNQVAVKPSAILITPNIGAATGTSVSVTGNITGGNVRTAGVVTATGNVTGGNITTTGVVTATGNIFTANTLISTFNATSIQPALQLSGTPYTGLTNIGLLQIGNTLTFNDENVFVSMAANANTYIQTVMQNLNSGGLASTDFVLNNDAGTSSTNYLAVGINSSGFDNDGSSFSEPNGTYVYSVSSNLAIGTGGANVINLATDETTRVIIDESGVVSVVGNVIAGNVNTGNIVSATGNIVTAGYFLGNGSFIDNVNVANINNGNSNVTVVANSNVTVSIAGISNTVVFTTDGVSVTGKVTANSFVGNNQVLTGNILAGRQVQLGNNNGGTSRVFYMEYNTANDAVDFIFG